MFLVTLLALLTAQGLHGTVREAGRLEPIRFALVEVVETGMQTITDQDGRFSLPELDEGDYALRISAPGYERSERPIRVIDGMGSVELLLVPSPIELGEITAIASRVRAIALVEAPEARILDTLAMRQLPAIAERDLLRAVQAEPSVTPSSDFSTALYVRGGTPDQTRVLLDGMPVHNTFHVGGFVSAFTAEATAAAVLRPGGLPSSAPSSLSGALEVHTRDGGRDSTRARGSLGLISSSATVDGPLGTNGAYLISARRTYVDLAFDAANLLGLTDQEFKYGFSDVMTKVTWDVGRMTSITASGYLNREGFDEPGGDDPYSAGWGSDALSLRARGIVGSRFAVEGGIGTSGFEADLAEFGGRDEGSGVTSSIRTWVADLEGRASLGAHLLFAGARWERTEVDHLYDTDLFDRLTALDVEGRYGPRAGFVRHRWTVTPHVTVDWGIRVEDGRNHAAELLPRGRIEWSLSDRSTVALSAGRYTQDWWSPRNEESIAAAVVGYDLPIPVPTDRALPSGWDAIVETRRRHGPWLLRLGAYHKRSRNVPIARVAPDPLNTPFLVDPDTIAVGKAHITGIEASANGPLAGGTFAASYRWQREERIVGAERWTPRTDRRHLLTVSALRPWTSRELAFSLTWKSGPPFSRVLGAEPGPGQIDREGRSGRVRRRLTLADPNGHRLPSYLRLDVAVRGEWKLSLLGARGRLEPYLSVLNVFNRTNALFPDYEASTTGSGVVVLERGPQIPVIPTFGVRWTF